MNYKEVIEFIRVNYTESEKPMTQKEIAKKFGLAESTISHLVTCNGLQRKYKFRTSKREMIEVLIKKGYRNKDVVKELGVSDGYVRNIKNKNKPSKRNWSEETLRRQKLGCADCLNYKTCNFVKCPFE